MAIAPLTPREYRVAQQIRAELLRGLETVEDIPDSYARPRFDAMLQQLTAAVREYEGRGWLARRIPPRAPPGTPRLRQVLEDHADTLQAAVDAERR